MSILTCKIRIGHHLTPCGCRACSSCHSPWSRSSRRRRPVPPLPLTPADDVRELGKSIEMLHPDAVPERLASAVPGRGERAGATRSGHLTQRAPGRRAAASSRSSARATGTPASFPGTPRTPRRSTSIPFASTTSPTASTSSTPRTRRSFATGSLRSRASPVERVLELVRAADALRQRVEPPRAGAALPAHGRGARRPRHHRRNRARRLHLRAS